MLRNAVHLRRVHREASACLCVTLQCCDTLKMIYFLSLSLFGFNRQSFNPLPTVFRYNRAATHHPAHYSICSNLSHEQTDNIRIKANTALVILPYIVFTDE